MSEIHLTDRALSRIVARLAEKVRENPSASKSALLNVATAEIVGPGHDWGLITNAEQPVISRDLASKSPAEPRPAKAFEGTPAAYLHEVRFSFLCEDDVSGKSLSLEDIAYECDNGDFLGMGSRFEISATPLTREKRDELALEAGSDHTFFGTDERYFDFVIEVSALVDFDEMDQDDLNEYGECAIDGSYAIRVGTYTDATPDEVEEYAIDAFHNSVGIANLEDFDIIVRRRRPQDNDEDMRAVLDNEWLTELSLDYLRNSGTSLNI